jgi:uncharacterized protein
VTPPLTSPRRALRNALAALILAALADPRERIMLDVLAGVLAEDRATGDTAWRARLAALGPVDREGAAGAPGAGLRRDLAGEREGLAARVSDARALVERYWQGGAPPRDRLERALVQAALLFERGLFFEVHEVLEPVWRELAGSGRRSVQGLIQVAVGLHHLRHGNPAGARAQLAAGRAKLAPAAPTLRGVAVEALLAGLPPFERAAAAERGWPEDLPPPPLAVRTSEGRCAGTA